MNRLWSSRTIAACAVLLGGLLLVGPILTSVAGGLGPCSQAASDSRTLPVPSEDVHLTADSVVDGLQWTCSKVVLSTVVRAVSPERFVSSMDHVGMTRTEDGSVPLTLFYDWEDSKYHLLMVPPELTVLRPVVLQI